MAGTSGLNMLPEDCVSTIISLTSPKDACNAFSVTSWFRSAAESDVVWERFLPSDYMEIVAKSVVPLKFSSKKELFFLLCNTIFIDGGKKCLSLDKSYGKKAYVLSARELSILRSNEPTHWSWKSNPNSRFLEVIELKTISQLEVQGKINTQMLSRKTKYGAYLIMQISNGAYGLNAIPSEISAKVGDHEFTSTAYLGKKDSRKLHIESLFYRNRMQMLKKRVNEGEERGPRERKDGWMEIELGEFFSGDKDEEVKMSLMEVKGQQLKGGLIIEGIEIRPKN